MNITTPRIVANSNNNNQNKKPFVKKEIKFNSQSQLKAYLADAVLKNKRKSFNMKVDLSS